MNKQGGMNKHRTSGKAVNSEHFTGIKGHKGTDRKQALTAKEKRRKQGCHVNKYQGVA